MEEGAGFDGSAFEGTGGWDMDMEVIVPVNSPVFAVETVEGFWEVVEGVTGVLGVLTPCWEGALAASVLAGGGVTGATGVETGG